MKLNRYLIFKFFLFILLSNQVFGQIIEVPLSPLNSIPNQRVKDTGPIDLPFWDDFSKSTGITDTSLWLSETSGVLVSPGLGLNAPSINVAVFDGWDITGSPYVNDPIFVGKTDSLVSRPIKLLNVPSDQRGTIYLSFYYQYKGNGELPDEPTDSLVLRFKNNSGNWDTVWPLPGENVVRDTDIFTKKVIQVTPEYLADDFQFMFQSYGRQNGPFDTWNVDYVFLDKNRSIFQSDAPDRAFTEPPSSILGQYTGMPIDHFLQSPQNWLDSAWSGFRNLQDLVQPVEYSVFLENSANGEIVDELLIDSAFVALVRPFEFRALPSGAPDSAKIVSYVSSRDSVVLRTRYEMDSGDKFLVDEVINGGLDTLFYENFDLRVNDTTSSLVYLDDYYAYDDGSAEFGAGINQLGGQIAYQFITEKPDFLNSVDIYFANIDKNQAGLPIEIIIRKDLEDLETSVLSTSTYSIQNTGLDSFGTYNLPRPVEVIDTFYVSVRQGTNEFIAIGLDKNTDTSNKIYFNVTGVWDQTQNLSGSLMIRPRFGGGPITSVEKELAEEKTYQIYPNPFDHRLFIKAEDLEDYRVLDLSGREIELNRHTNYLDTSSLRSGMYILRLKVNDRWHSEKIIKQ